MSQNITDKPELIIVFDKNKIIPVGEAFPELLPKIQKVEQFGKTIKQTMQQGKNPEDEDLTKYGNMLDEVYLKVKNLTDNFKTDTINRLWKETRQKSILPKGKTAFTIQEIIKDCLLIPNNKEFQMVQNSFVSNDDIPLFISRSEKINEKTNISFIKKGQTKKIVITSTYKDKKENTTLTLYLPNIDFISAHNDKFSKVFTFILAKINEQAINKETHKLYKDFITFSLQELVELGIYKNVKSAKDGINKVYKKLYETKIKIVNKNNKWNMEKETGLFRNDKEKITDIEHRQNYYKIYLNKGSIFTYLDYVYFTIIPKWAYVLSNRAFLLTKLIFARARQNPYNKETKTVDFTISMRLIQRDLNLPDEDKTLKHLQLIKRPILESIEQIENKYNETLQEKIKDLPEQEQKNYEKYIDINILHQPENRADKLETMNIKEFLDSQHLKITLKGSFAEFFKSKKHKNTIDLLRTKNK